MCLAFNPQSTLVATSSMDTTAKLWDVESGEEVATLTVRYPFLKLCPIAFLALLILVL